MNTNRILILKEAAMHPHSMLIKIEGAFERPSIIRVAKKDGLRSYNKPPIYDDKYLVIFETVKAFKANMEHIKLNYMFPVILCTSTAGTNDAKAVCQEKGLPYFIFNNPFEKSDAFDLIYQIASVKVTESFCKALVRRTGLNPQRIISAITVCEQVGYKESNISKYIDKYIYIDIYDVIESLLGICKSGAQIKRAALYVHMNRVWYKSFTRNLLVKELNTLIKVYRDFLDGVVTNFTLHDYIDHENISRYRVLYVRDLLERVSISELLALRCFLENSTVLDVSLRLT